MKQIILYVIFLLFIVFTTEAQDKPALGRADSYTVLAGTGVNNSGDTKIDGNLGVSPGTVATGFPPGLVSGRRDINNAAAINAQTDLTLAYNQAASVTASANMSGQNLGGRTLTPGVYKFNNNATLTGNLVLDNGGNPDAVFIFQIGADFTVSNGATINFSGTAPPRAINIFWQVTGSAFIGDNSVIKGSVLANQNITMSTGTSIQGRLLARNGTVSLTNNAITIPPDLEITQTVSPGLRKSNIYSIGDQVTFTITARNLGPIHNTNVRIDHRLGAGLNFISASLAGSSYDAVTGIRTWTLPNFANGAVQTIVVVARITNNASVLIESRASITGDKVDEILLNNTRTVDLCVMPADPGVITGPAAVCARGTDYTFSVAPITGALSYNWALPAGWSFTSERNSSTIKVTAGIEPGEITVTVNNICGETLASSKSITVSTTPSPAPGPITPSNGTNNPCIADRTITYTIDPVIGANSYRWEKPGDWVITSGQGTRSITVTVGSASGEIKVFAVNGCGDSDPSVLPVVPSAASPSQPVAINGSPNPCINESNTYSVNPVAGATSYRWIVPASLEILSGQGTATITVKPLTNANATIRVEALNGCGQTAVSLVVNPVAKVKPGSISGPANPCMNTSSTYSIDPVPGATSYFWTVPGLSNVPGQGTTTITFVPTGSTIITVSALFECGFSSPESFNITPINRPARPAAIVSSKQQVCANKEVTFSIPAVTGATRYEWEASGDWVIKSGQNTTSIIVTAGTTESTIKVVAVNACGPSESRTLLMQPLLNAPAPPLAISGIINPCGAKVVTYAIEAVVNAAGYTWSVPNASWEILSGQGTASIQVKVGTGSGNISVAANNDCGSSTAKTLAVAASAAVPAAPGAITSSLEPPCANQNNVTFSVPVVTGVNTYTWTVTESAGWEIKSGQGTNSITVNVGTGAGTVSVSAVNDCGPGVASTLDITPTASIPVTPVQISGSLIPCANQSELVYSIAPVTHATRYVWAVTGTDWQITSGQGSTSVRVIAGAATGTISVKAVNNCGESPAQILTVTPGAGMPPRPGPITGNTNLCAGQTSLTYSVPAQNNTEAYEWTLPEGWSIVSGDGRNSIVVNVGSGAGNIRVRAKNGCGMSDASELAVAPTVAAPAAPAAIQASKTLFCAGETSLAYSVAPVARASTYTWTVPEGWTITSGHGTNTILVTAGNIPGNISLMVYNNCGAASATLAVAPNVKPADPGRIIGNSIPCARSTGNTYRIDNVPGANRYEWEVPAGWRITAGANTTAITVEAGSEAGNITVTAFNDCGSTAATLAVTPANGPPESIGAISGKKSVCAGNIDNLSYSVAAVTNASEYIWTVPVGWEIVSGQGAAAITVKSNNNSGTISVTINNGCGIGATSSTFVVVSGQAPSQPGSITGQTALCSDKEVRYTIGTVSGATGYVWEVPAGWEITAGQGTPAITVRTGNASGKVSVKSANDCGSSLEASTLAVAITTVPVTPVAITGDKNQCAGNTGKVYSIEEVAGATSYTWAVPADWEITAGQGTAAITITAGSASGNVSVTAGNNCGLSEAQIMAVISASTPSPAPARIYASNSLICSEQEDLITYSIDPVATATSYFWQVPAGWTIADGQETTIIKVKVGTAAGNIEVKALNGCGESNASILPVDPTTTAAVSIGSITGETTSCSGQVGLVYAVPEVPGATTYTWVIPQGWKITNGAGTNSITVTVGSTSGNVSVKAANSCATSSESSLPVQINPSLPALAPIKDIGSSCTGLAYTVPTVDGAIAYTWTVPAGWEITTGQGTNSIKVTAPVGSQKGLVSVVAQTPTCNTTPVSLEADPARTVDLTIANVFSPNGDGVNDTWEILNIQHYPENDLVVINRWGSEVYRSKSYHNQWDGGELSAGTYFYVLKVKVCDGSYKTHKGYVMIMK